MYSFSLKLLVTALTLTICSFVVADDAFKSELFTADEGCMDGPLAQFGRYIGQWKIEDETLSREDGQWHEGDGARWDFHCLGNGTAIQDFWMPNGGGTGTNLRTWNKDKESWDVVWTHTGMSGYSQIEAKQDENGSIVMHVIKPLPSPLRRITFFEPQTDSWDWKLEISADDGESWMEVYRIHASRIGAQ